MGDVIEPGMDGRHVIARVERERQALAMMDRPNIARVRDAGPTSARLPCFVMDLVDGVRITRYCDSRKPGLNRDIKPSNELVEERDGSPTPRVIDFTPAKALDSQITDDGTMLTGLGTVAGLCTSREEAKQGRQDIDTLSGICSLGAVAFELVTGTTPIERERLEKSDYVAIPRTK